MSYGAHSIALEPMAAWRAIRDTGLLNEEDTAVLYYSLADLDRRLAYLSVEFSGFAAMHLVAIKSAPHPAILKRIVERGYGLEAASFEEVLMAVQAGAPAERIAYNSPVKTRHELARCVAELPGLRLNANCIEELERLPQDHGLAVGLRINPLIDPGSRSSLFNVSGADSKFGVPISQQEEIAQAVLKHRIGTLHVHVGSQSSAFDRVAEGIALVFRLARSINARLLANGGEGGISTINIGGGVPFDADPLVSERNMAAYSRALRKALGEDAQGFEVITEFGQWVHGNNGIAFTQVEYARELNARRLAYVHVGADLLTRHVYAQSQDISFQTMSAIGAPIVLQPVPHDIAGPLCFHGDFIARGVLLPQLSAGDMLAICGIGANTFGLWSRHCSRALPAFFVHDGSGVRLASSRSLSTSQWL